MMWSPAEFVGLIYWCPVEHRRKEVALRSVQVEARVVDLCASVQLTQRYVNTTSTPVEAVYVFPVDNRAAVSGFEVEIDGVITKANVQEKVEARQTYEAAVAAGDSAQLLEQVRDDVFQMSVGNLQPHSVALIRITYVADVAIEGDGVLFFLPAFVAPRYTPAGAEGVPSGDAGVAREGLRLDLVAAMSSDVVSVESQTAGIGLTVTPMPGNSRVRTISLAGDVMRLEKDLIVKITTKEPHQPRCLVEHDVTNNTYAGVVTLCPQIEFDDERRELVFIVDRSGSMSGYNIAQAKKALQLFFRSLPSDCYINIIGFGSRYESLWPKSVKYGASTLQKASRHIETLQANLGGTEICAPLRNALQQPPVAEGYARQVFVLTDGQVSNTDETIGVVREAVRVTPTTRVFALGLGNGASHELVEGIAEAGAGTSAFCVGDENLKEKVVAQLSRAIQPALTDVVIEWEGAAGAPPDYAVDHEDASGGGGGAAPAPSAPPRGGGGLLDAFAPASAGSLLAFSARSTPRAHNPADAEGFARAPFRAPPIHTGARFLSYCLVNKGGKPPTSVHITAKSPAGPLDVRLAVTLGDMVEGTLLHTMAARSLIHDLEKGRSWLHGPALGSGDPSVVKGEIVRLGTTYSLASKHTSFVAVQRGDHPRREVFRPPPRPDMVFAACNSLSMAMPCAAPQGAFMRSAKKSKGGGFGLGSLFGSSGARGGGGGGRGGGGGGLFSRSGSRSRAAAPQAEMMAAPARASSSSCSAPPAPSAAPSGGFMGGSLFGGLVGDVCDDSMAVESDRFEGKSKEMSRKKKEKKSTARDEFDSSWATMSVECESSAMSEDDSEENIDKQSAVTIQSMPSDVLCERIVALQSFDGSFALTSELTTLLGSSVDAIKAAASEYGSSSSSETMVVTALVIAFFRSKLAALKAEWVLVEAKALKWLARAATSASSDSNAVLTRATAILA